MTSAPTPRRRLRRATAVAAVATLLLVAVGATGDAGAQTVEDKKAEAARIAAQLDDLGQEYSRLDEQYHQAVMDLEEADAAVAEAEADVQATRDQLSESEGAVKDYAVEAYVGGDNVPGFDVILGSDPDEVPTRRTYLSTASGDRQDLMDQLAASREDLDVEIDALESRKSEAQQMRDDAAAAKERAQGTIADAEALEAKVQGELAELVDQERARQAAAEAKRAEQSAREAADAAGDDAPPAVTETPRGTTPGPGPAPGPSPAPGGGGDAPPGAGTAVSVAYSLIGTPYVWGGGSPSGGFDCSGFTSYVWRQGGKSLPHSSAAQYAMTRRISMSELQPGDLVFYGRPSVHHVALYVGGGTIVHAPGTGKFVRQDSVYYWDALVGAGRLP